MKQTITTTQLSNAVGEIVSSVRLRGDCYIISQRGKEEVALVPVEVLEAYERSRQRAVDLMDRVAGKAPPMDDNELQAFVSTEVKRARKARRSKDGRQSGAGK